MGPNSTNAMSCASGTIAIGDAFRAIRDGYADVMFAGARGGAARAAVLRRVRDHPRDVDAQRRSRRPRRARSTRTATAS